MAKSGHEAGWEFAERVGITQQYEVDNYMGNSDSFRAGMQQYLDQLKKKEEAETATTTTTTTNNQ
jgi:hypothetical protein